MYHGLLSKGLLACGIFLASVQVGAATLVAGGADTLLSRAETYYADGNVSQATQLYREAFDITGHHSEAYGKLVQIALDQRDAVGLKHLFDLHRAFPFEDLSQFRHRVQLYEMVRLRDIYSTALQAAATHQWAQAERDFSLLLGDEAYHSHAAGWLFRLAMQQKNFERAKFIATLPQDYINNPAATPELLLACVLQRTDQHEPALAQIKAILTQRGAYHGTPAARVDAQRTVYLAMIRLHEQNDQCYLNAWNKVAEARPYFPDLPDAALQYLAR